MIGPHYQLMGAAGAIAVQMTNAYRGKGEEMRKLAIARRHALAGARILAPDQDAYERITSMLEMPVEGV